MISNLKHEELHDRKKSKNSLQPASAGMVVNFRSTILKVLSCCPCSIKACCSCSIVVGRLNNLQSEISSFMLFFY